MNFQKSKFAGGIARLWILPLQYYNGVKFNTTSGLYYPLGIKGKLTDVPISIDSCSYSIKKKGSAYDVNISCFIPGISFYNLQASIELEAIPFLIIARDYNNNFILFGDYDNFFLYSSDIESNKDYSEPAGINFSLSKTMLHMPLLIEDPFVNNKPVASNVIILGSGSVGETLIGQYFYHDDDGDSEGNSLLKWYQSDDENGTNKEQIADGDTFLVSESNEGKYIQFAVIPHDGTEYGNEVFSEYLKINFIDDNIIPNTIFDGIDITWGQEQYGQDVISFKAVGNIITISHLASGIDVSGVGVYVDIIPEYRAKILKVEYDFKINKYIEEFSSSDEKRNFLSLFYNAYYANNKDLGGYGERKYVSFDRELVNEWQSGQIILNSSGRGEFIYELGFFMSPDSIHCIEGLKIELRIKRITILTLKDLWY